VNTTTRFRQPALIGGLVIGVLSALPFINFANCCCLWIIGGGVIAAYVLQSSEPEPIAPGDGALAGLLAGLTGAVIQFVISIPIDILLGPLERRVVQALVEMINNPQFQEPLQRSLDESANGGILALILRRFAWLLIMLLVTAVFSTIGGVLGSVIFKKPPVPTTERG
jgi:hypothetical protein